MNGVRLYDIPFIEIKLLLHFNGQGFDHAVLPLAILVNLGWVFGEKLEPLGCPGCGLFLVLLMLLLCFVSGSFGPCFHLI